MTACPTKRRTACRGRRGRRGQVLLRKTEPRGTAGTHLQLATSSSSTSTRRSFALLLGLLQRRSTSSSPISCRTSWSRGADEALRPANPGARASRYPHQPVSRLGEPVGLVEAKVVIFKLHPHKEAGLLPHGRLQRNTVEGPGRRSDAVYTSKSTLQQVTLTAAV